MKKKFYYGFAASFVVQTAFSQVVINEIDSDTPGTDSAEFIEIYAGTPAVTSLDGYVLVFFNGSNDTSYGAYSLDGFSTNAEGLFVVGNPGVANVGLTIDPGGSGAIQNGADAVAIYTGTVADFPNGTAATETNLVDGLVYDTNDADDSELLAVFGGAQLNEDEGGDKDNESIQRNPDGSTDFTTTIPTPGTTNTQDPLLELVLTPSSVAESAGADAIEAEILLPSAAVGDLTITIAISDNTELSAPVSVTIPDGDDFFVFDIDAVDDAIADGLQSVDVTISALGYQDATVTVFVSDDDLTLPDVVINEMQIKDGDTNPQFVELYNYGSTPIDLAGWSVKAFGSDPSFADDYGTEMGSFDIPSGTLAPSDFYLIGDSAFEAIYGIIPDLQAEPGFDTFDITVILFDGDDNAVFTVLNTNDEEQDQANNAGANAAADLVINDGGFSAAGYFLDVDGGTSASILEFTPAPAVLATPGTTNEEFIARLQVEIAPALIVESAGSAAATATITRLNETSEPLTVTVTSSDLSELTVDSATVEFAAGEFEQTVTLTAIDESDEDGLQVVTVTASATGFVAGSGEVSVADDDSSVAELVINEMIIDSDGADTEFLEIYNSGSEDADLQGYSIELWESDSGQSGLDGGSPIEIPSGAPVIVPAGGYYLIANSAFATAYPSVTVDYLMTESFENSSATIILRDSNGTVVFSVFATDGGADDVANIDGTPIVPDAIGNDTAFALLPDGDASNVVTIDNGVPSTDATPGATNGEAPVGDYAVTIEGSSYDAGQFVINFTASASSDVYVSTDLESFTLATGGSAVASGTYTDTAPPVGKAFYLIQEAGTPAP